MSDKIKSQSSLKVVIHQVLEDKSSIDLELKLELILVINRKNTRSAKKNNIKTAFKSGQTISP